VPTSSRDFQRAAAQRLTTAEFLLLHRYNLDAMYLAGYTVECSLKDLGTPIPVEFVKRLRRSGWSTALRYESGRWDTGETRGFLNTARAVYNWVEGQIP
jgi:hypothetical protein